MTQSNFKSKDDQPIPEGYKKTEVGIIPNDWQLECIGNIVNITTGNKNTQDRISEGKYPFFVRSQKIERINSFSFDGEGVLTAGDGVGTGKVFHYINGKFDFHQRVYLMHSFNQKVNGYYFYIYFSNNFYDRIMSMTAKSSVDSVRRDMISNMKIVLPTLREQQKIAGALSDTDALISELEKLIEKKQAIKTTTMQQLLTGKTRLPEFALREDGTPKAYKESELGQIPEDWGIVSLGDIGQAIIGLTYSPNDTAEFGSLVLRSSNVQNGKLSFDNNVFVKMTLPDRVIVKEGDILICVRNGSRQLIGKCALIDKKTEGSAFGAFMSIYRTASYGFIFYQFQSNIIQNQINETMGATINQITNKDLNSFKIMQPLEDRERTLIYQTIKDLEAGIDIDIKRLDKLKFIKQGMMQELLTGKTRLV
jgi:type I restriction enzyme S subunit